MTKKTISGRVDMIHNLEVEVGRLAAEIHNLERRIRILENSDFGQKATWKVLWPDPKYRGGINDKT